MLKVELHAHTSDDPEDYIPYTVERLVNRMAALRYDAVAITLHNRQLDLEPFRDAARARGVVLIPGIERSIEGKHVLLLNYPAHAAAAVQRFEDLASLRDRFKGLVIAPHPFFGVSSCVGAALERLPYLFDAVELHALYPRVSTLIDAPSGGPAVTTNQWPSMGHPSSGTTRHDLVFGRRRTIARGDL